MNEVTGTAMFGNLTELQRHRLRKNFNKKVDRSGGPDACWPWTGATQKSPRAACRYGHMKIPGTRTNARAHRISYFLDQDIDPGVWLVTHTCDNSMCCNPTHLQLGDHEANMKDKITRFRVPRPNAVGSNNRAAKLNENDVRAILRAIKSGERDVNIARRYGVSASSILLIRKNKTWTHVSR